MAKKVAAEVIKPEVKTAKPVIVIADLKLPKDVHIKTMKTCSVITNDTGNKWYLKGHTLEITTALPELENRLEKFSKAVIEKCHLGHVTCVIRDVVDTDDLEGILKVFSKTPGVKKVEEKPAAKETKAPKAKKAAKAKKVVAETPAPVVPEVVAEVPASVENMIDTLAA